MAPKLHRFAEDPEGSPSLRKMGGERQPVGASSDDGNVGHNALQDGSMKANICVVSKELQGRL